MENRRILTVVPRFRAFLLHNILSCSYMSVFVCIVQWFISQELFAALRTAGAFAVLAICITSVAAWFNRPELCFEKAKLWVRVNGKKQEHLNLRARDIDCRQSKAQRRRNEGTLIFRDERIRAYGVRGGVNRIHGVTDFAAVEEHIRQHFLP